MNEEEPEVIETDDEPEEEAGGLSPKGKAFLIIGIVLAAVLLIGLYVYHSRNAAVVATEEEKPEAVVSVKVAKAEKGSIAKEVSALGSVAAAKESTVAASISAQIVEMGQLKNSLVHKGDVLAVLASQDLQAQRREAQAAVDEARLNLETLQKVTIPQTSAQTEKELADAKAEADNARTVYERRRDLYAKGGISLKEVEASRLALTNAEDNLRLVRKNASLNTSAVNPNARAIAETKIREAESHLRTIEAQAGLARITAPITGIVTEQFAFQGDFASAGGKLLTVADISEVVVKAPFANAVAADLENGDQVTIYPNTAPDESISGTVTLISRSADPQNRSVEVWARFANGQGRLRPGDAVKFVVSSGAVNEAVIIPLSAVQFETSDSDEGTVMVVDGDSIAHETKVKVGVRNGDKVQITEGLEGGETVVTEGNYSLPDGTKVEAAKEEEPEEKE
jgi:multidrug efflux pump subunit AcrA (membrane-fusion protein)